MQFHKTAWERNPQCGMCSVWQVIINCWQYNFSFDADLFFIKNNQGTFAWGGTASQEAGTAVGRWLLTYLPRAEHASCWGSQRVTSSSWSWGFFIKPRGFGSEGAMPQAVLLVRRCFTYLSNVWKMKFKGLGTIPWKAAFAFGGGGKALSKSDREYLVLEWTRIFVLISENYTLQCSGGKIRKREIAWVSFESLDTARLTTTG